MISARIICDSISLDGQRLITMVLRYPRFIHAEFMTHRMLSRNVASSRAIPVKKYLKQVWSNPAMPVWWGANQPGMQAKRELAGWRKWLAIKLWVLAGWTMCGFAKLFELIGLHKQVANRILEPWVWVETVCTATDYDNLFWLRDHPEAQPEFGVLAAKMVEALNNSTPVKLKFGEWHLPFVLPEELLANSLIDCIKFSVARCARVSFLNHDGTNPNHEKDLKLWNQLISSGHVSPFEHQATPNADGRHLMSGNFRGWIQNRKNIFNEYRNSPYYKLN